MYKQSVNASALIVRNQLQNSRYILSRYYYFVILLPTTLLFCRYVENCLKLHIAGTLTCQSSRLHLARLQTTGQQHQQQHGDHRSATQRSGGHTPSGWRPPPLIMVHRHSRW